jgi:hypothetical protein
LIQGRKSVKLLVKTEVLKMIEKTIKKLSLFFFILVFTGRALALPPPDPRFPKAGIGFELNY